MSWNIDAGHHVVYESTYIYMACNELLLCLELRGAALFMLGTSNGLELLCLCSEPRVAWSSSVYMVDSSRAHSSSMGGLTNRDMLKRSQIKGP